MSEMNENYCLRMVTILTSKIKQKETTMNLNTVSCVRFVSLNERSLNVKSNQENLMIFNSIHSSVLLAQLLSSSTFITVEDKDPSTLWVGNTLNQLHRWMTLKSNLN